MARVAFKKVVFSGSIFSKLLSIRARYRSLGALFLMAVCCYSYLPAQVESGDSESAASRAAIIAHLNSAIQFYRSNTQPIQKAGEPNDLVYSDQAITLAAQATTLAFQSAKAQAAFIGDQVTVSNAQGEEQRLQNAAANVTKQVSDLETQQKELEKQIETARPSARKALLVQKEQLGDALELANAMKDALGKIVGISGAHGSTGFRADIDRLEQTVPELQGKNKIAEPQLTTLESARSAGVTSQGRVLFELLETRRSLQLLLRSNEALHQQALQLRAPLSGTLRSTIKQGQQLSQQALSGGPADQQQTGTSASSKLSPIDEVTQKFKAISAATVPMSQEIIVLEQSRSNILAWEASVESEYKSILYALLLRIIIIAIALVLIVAGGEIWTRATTRYVRDLRRRRQLLMIRRVVVGFLSVIVILFGFITQFNSLATFAGFITAGIAVGLQTILLSVAAYFFIIGRYGVKVGDRITIASVTGDVIEVGLVRFYMMELAGSATELHPTGRIAVFSNAVLFQAGTPLYKQIPGTEYAWHELIVKLTDAADYKTVCNAVVKEVNTVYDSYREVIEAQHRSVENWMQTNIDPPGVESRLQFNGGTFQLWVRFPVKIDAAADTDEKITQGLLDMIAKTPEVKGGIAAIPTIQASIRG